jgi:hypothetical protein
MCPKYSGLTPMSTEFGDYSTPELGARDRPSPNAGFDELGTVAGAGRRPALGFLRSS